MVASTTAPSSQGQQQQQPIGQQQQQQQQPQQQHGETPAAGRLALGVTHSPLKRRSTGLAGAPSRGGLSRNYSGKSQSFCCIEDLARNPWIQSALALAKRRPADAPCASLPLPLPVPVPVAPPPSPFAGGSCPSPCEDLTCLAWSIEEEEGGCLLGSAALAAGSSVALTASSSGGSSRSSSGLLFAEPAAAAWVPAVAAWGACLEDGEDTDEDVCMTAHSATALAAVAPGLPPAVAGCCGAAVADELAVALLSTKLGGPLPLSRHEGWLPLPSVVMERG